MSPLAIGAIVFGIAATGAALGFFGCAIFTSKSIADWRDRLLDLAKEMRRAGHPVPGYAIVEKTEFTAYMRRPLVKRGRPIVPAIAIAIITAGICGITLFLCLATKIGTKDAIAAAAICGLWSGAGAWSLWAGWPMRRPRVGPTFIEKWADKMPISMEKYYREKYVQQILEAVDVDVEKEQR